MHLDIIDDVSWSQLLCVFIYSLAQRASAGVILALAGMDSTPRPSLCEVNWGNPPPTVDWDRLKSARTLILQSTSVSLLI